MDYIVEPGSDGLLLDLEPLDEAELRLVGGEVSLAGTSSPARLEIDGVTGAPVTVWLDDGVLTVEQPGPLSSGLVRPRATVALTVPPAARAASGKAGGTAATSHRRRPGASRPGPPRP